MVTTVLLGGFLLYDKLLKKVEPVECPKCEEKECPKIETEECPKCETCNCSICTNNGEKISSLKEIKLTTTNQTVKVGSKTLKIRKGSTNDDYDNVYVDDIPIAYSDNIRISVNKVYLTNKFMFFTTAGMMGDRIEYTISGDIDISNHYSLGVNNNDYGMRDFKLVNGYLRATGALYCGIGEVDCPDKDLIIKYIDNTLIVVPYK